MLIKEDPVLFTKAIYIRVDQLGQLVLVLHSISSDALAFASSWCCKVSCLLALLPRDMVGVNSYMS